MRLKCGVSRNRPLMRRHWGGARAAPAVSSATRTKLVGDQRRQRPPYEWRVFRTERPEGSYTVALLDDPQLTGEKVMEEAEEVARAARDESDERVDNEAADVLYHLAVLLRGRDRSIADAGEVLNGRRR